jgi:hypothetical protein
VAAGATMPRELWLELPGSPGETARAGVLAIDAWLALPGAQREAQRAACASYAAQSWQWAAAAHSHLAWLQGAAA